MGSIPHCSTGTPGPCWFESQCAGSDESDTQQTVREMCAVIHQCAGDPLMRAEAERCFSLQHVIRPGLSSWCDLAARAAYAAAKSRLKFKLDEITLQRLLNKRGERDFLQWPTLVVRGVVKEGDCDCFTMYMLTLLECLGVPWRIVTVKCDPKDPSRWAHVYAVIDLENGQRLPLDASHFKQPGEEVPAHHVFEYAEWDMDGNRIPVSFRPVPMGAYRPRGFRGYRGFGDDGDDDGSSTPLLDPTVDSGNAILPLPLPTPVVNTLPPQSSGISPSEQTALTNFANSLTKIFGQTVAPQTTIIGPGGTSITGPSSAISSLTNPLGGINTASLSGLLPLALLAGGGLLLFSMLSKK